MARTQSLVAEHGRVPRRSLAVALHVERPHLAHAGSDQLSDGRLKRLLVCQKACSSASALRRREERLEKNAREPEQWKKTRVRPAGLGTSGV